MPALKNMSPFRYAKPFERRGKGNRTDTAAVEYRYVTKWMIGNRRSRMEKYRPEVPLR